LPVVFLPKTTFPGQLQKITGVLVSVNRSRIDGAVFCRHGHIAPSSPAKAVLIAERRFMVLSLGNGGFGFADFRKLESVHLAAYA